MESKRLIQGFIVLLIVSLACAAIYAAETGEVSHTDSSKTESHLYISGSGDVCHVVDSFGPTHDINDNLLTVYV